jgi:hypothetical protein
MPSATRGARRNDVEGESEEDEELVPTEMPLLDAVQTLVEKERQLMELKVAEAAHEANGKRRVYLDLKRWHVYLQIRHRIL